jgi:hypothetical protein
MPKIKLNTLKVHDLRTSVKRGPTARAKDAAFHERQRVKAFLSVFFFAFDELVDCAVDALQMPHPHKGSLYQRCLLYLFQHWMCHKGPMVMYGWMKNSLKMKLAHFEFLSAMLAVSSRIYRSYSRRFLVSLSDGV